MKKFIILAAVCLSSVVSAFAQHVTDSLSTDTVVVTPDSVMVVAPEVVSVPVQIVKYGYVSYSQVLISSQVVHPVKGSRLLDRSNMVLLINAIR